MKSRQHEEFKIMLATPKAAEENRMKRIINL